MLMFSHKSARRIFPGVVLGIVASGMLIALAPEEAL